MDSYHTAALCIMSLVLQLAFQHRKDSLVSARTGSGKMTDTTNGTKCPWQHAQSKLVPCLLPACAPRASL